MKKLNSLPGILFLSILFVLLSTAPLVFLTDDYAAWRENWWSAGPTALLAVVAMLALPVLVIKKIFKESLRDYGARLPENFRNSIRLTIAAVVILLPAVIFFGFEKSFQDYYFIRNLSLPQFLYAALLASLLYYAAEEFLFRGFLFFGLLRRIGYHAFWVSALIFSLFHITKPLPEVFFAFLAGLVFGFLSFKTKSFIPAAVAHLTLALVLNVLIFFILSDSSVLSSGTFRF